MMRYLLLMMRYLSKMMGYLLLMTGLFPWKEKIQEEATECSQHIIFKHFLKPTVLQSIKLYSFYFEQLLNPKMLINYQYYITTKHDPDEGKQSEHLSQLDRQHEIPYLFKNYSKSRQLKNIQKDFIIKAMITAYLQEDILRFDNS